MLSCSIALAVSARAAAAPPEDGRVYQEGIDDYARGDPDAALAAFRAVLRRTPHDRSALAAVRRLEYESAARRAARRPASERPAPAGALEHFFLSSLPRWYFFERSIGDGLTDVGTLEAANARIVQLLGERTAARVRRRPFRNDRRLRELLRRAPLAAPGHGRA